MSEGNIDPKTLAQQLKANGFRWAAFLLHDGLTADPIDGAWIQRFRQAAGGSVLLGGWGVNREHPESEAALAAQLVDRYDLPFYIANAEMEYKYSGDDGYSPERFGRSRRFVDAFRARKPDLPAAVSSFCHAKNHDIDWAVWRDAGFDFLPQAYANDFGADFGPDSCAQSAADAFPMDRVHPTVGTYPSAFRVSAEQYVTMLSRSATTGFSLYLAEVDMSAAKWKTYGRAARAEVGDGRLARPRHAADRPDDGPRAAAGADALHRRDRAGHHVGPGDAALLRHPRRQAAARDGRRADAHDPDPRRPEPAPRRAPGRRFLARPPRAPDAPPADGDLARPACRGRRGC